MAVDDLGGEVYFITDGEVIKIGWSGAPKVRMKALQIGRKRLRIMASFVGTMADERALHIRFKKLRRYGEWFRQGPELLEFIEAVNRRKMERRGLSPTSSVGLIACNVLEYNGK